MRTIVVGIGVTALILVSGCANSEEPRGETHAPPSPARIAALFDEWNAALQTGDPQRVADRYAADAVLIPTKSDEIRTDRAGIVDYFTDFLPSHPSAEIEQSVIDVLGADHAVDSGRYRFTLHDDGGVEIVDARYTFVYERQGDDWLIVNHHSSQMPTD